MVIVTNRKLCKVDFIDRVKEIVDLVNPVIVLREKDLTKEEYFELAQKLDFVENLYLQDIDIARKLNKDVHLPFKVFMDNDLKGIRHKSCSVHSIEEAVIAESKGATFLVTGHIFKTDCKKGLEPRGLDFLEKLVSSVHIPVVGIGGIDETNAKLVLNSGAKSFAIMSSVFVRDDIREYILKLKQIEKNEKK